MAKLSVIDRGFADNVVAYTAGFVSKTLLK